MMKICGTPSWPKLTQADPITPSWPKYEADEVLGWLSNKLTQVLSTKLTQVLSWLSTKLTQVYLAD